MIQSLMKLLHTPDDNLDRIEPASLDPVLRIVLKTVLKLDEMLD